MEFCLKVAMRKGMTHGMCDMTAETLRQVSTYRLHSSRCIPKIGFDESPKAIVVSTNFHELKATTNSETSRISNYSNGDIMGDERHVTHEICAVIIRTQTEIKYVAAKAYLKYFNH